MAGGALIFVQVICGLISLLEPATASLELGVAYPIISIRSVVELSCREDNFNPANGAQFRRNNEVITTDSDLVSVVSEGTGTITFSFTQQQEGVFTCTDQTSTSNAIALAGKYVLHVVLMSISMYVCYNVIALLLATAQSSTVFLFQLHPVWTTAMSKEIVTSFYQALTVSET